MSTSNTIYSVLSCIALLLTCIQMPWHLKAWNIGTCLYIIWTALSLLMFFINSIIWRNDALNRAPVWCEISSRLILGGTVGIPAASLCINRGLYNITTLQTITWSKTERRRTIMIDLAIGVGIPVAAIICRFIVQWHQFAIFEELGCSPPVLNTIPTLVFICGPSAVLSSITVYYAVRSIIKRRRTEEELKKHLFTISRFNASLWYRLLALASIEALVVAPFSLFGIITNITLNSFSRSTSWKGTHSAVPLVTQFPSTLWKASSRNTVLVELPRWAKILYAFNFFFLFGCSTEARRHYKMAWDFLMRRIGGRGTAETTPSLRFQALSERLSFKRSRTGRDLETSFSSGRGGDSRATLGSEHDQEKMPEESLPKSLAPAHTR